MRIYFTNQFLFDKKKIETLLVSYKSLQTLYYFQMKRNSSHLERIDNEEISNQAKKRKINHNIQNTYKSRSLEKKPNINYTICDMQQKLSGITISNKLNIGIDIDKIYDDNTKDENMDVDSTDVDMITQKCNSYVCYMHNHNDMICNIYDCQGVKKCNNQHNKQRYWNRNNKFHVFPRESRCTASYIS